ncbi:Translocon-associated protein subunit delta, partial [Stegodyphus mimosarum]
MRSLILVLCIHFSVFLFALGEICKSPVVNPSIYTTTDGMVVSEVALITEFSVTCDGSAKDFTLYADVKGNAVPAVKSAGSSKYQVSWTEDSTKISSGDHGIKIYDEEGFAALRKAQRQGEDASGLPSAFSVSVYHQGTYYGPWVQSEFLAAAFSIILWYIAFSARSKLIS